MELDKKTVFFRPNRKDADKKFEKETKERERERILYGVSCEQIHIHVKAHLSTLLLSSGDAFRTPVHSGEPLWFGINWIEVERR